MKESNILINLNKDYSLLMTVQFEDFNSKNILEKILIPMKGK
jgi:hypothetical protein